MKCKCGKEFKVYLRDFLCNPEDMIVVCDCGEKERVKIEHPSN